MFSFPFQLWCFGLARRRCEGTTKATSAACKQRKLPCCDAKRRAAGSECVILFASSPHSHEPLLSETTPFTRQRGLAPCLLLCRLHRSLSPSRRFTVVHWAHQERRFTAKRASWGPWWGFEAKHRITWSGPQPRNLPRVRRKVKHLHFKIKHHDTWKRSTFLFRRFSPLPNVPEHDS